MTLSKILLAITLTSMVSNTVFAQETNKTTTPTKDLTTLNETIKTIHQRKSVRHFTNKEVTKEQLEALVRAGMAAPTAINSQPWQFLVVTDKDLKAKYAEGNGQADMIKASQALIVVCGDMTIGTERSRSYWDQDCSAATENILLAAESLGLGAVWTGVYPGEERIKTVKERFELPENIIPLCVILVGYPEGDLDKPKDKWKPERLHWTKY